MLCWYKLHRRPATHIKERLQPWWPPLPDARSTCVSGKRNSSPLWDLQLATNYTLTAPFENCVYHFIALQVAYLTRSNWHKVANNIRTVCDNWRRRRVYHTCIDVYDWPSDACNKTPIKNLIKDLGAWQLIYSSIQKKFDAVVVGVRCQNMKGEKLKHRHIRHDAARIIGDNCIPHMSHSHLIRLIIFNQMCILMQVLPFMCCVML